jgi:hypothetical protein
MLTQVSVWRLQLVHYLRGSTAGLVNHLSICLIEMINVVLLLTLEILPGLLILEKFGHDTLAVRICLTNASLYIHSTTMDSVELVVLSGS